MEPFLQDLRYSARKLAASPGFTTVAVVTLALAIGASTAVFSVVDSVLLAPLPYSEPDRLVLLWNRMTASSFERAPVSAPDVIDYRDQARLFSGIAASNNVGEGTVTGDGRPEQIKIGGVTANFFAVLGAEPLFGRTFVPDDEAPPPPPPADASAPPPAPSPNAMVLAHGFWQRRFGGDRGILGKTISINGFPSVVVGVMRPGFRLLMPADAGMPTDIDAWQPLRFDLAAGARDQQFLRVVARLAPGATLAAAQQEMDRIAERQRAEHQFHENMGIHVVVRPMAADVVEGVRPVLLALLGAVAFVLLIACFNVANLMLARSAIRGRETAVRAALGAGRWRIARQVLAEGLLLAVAGGLAGVALAWGGLRALLALRPPDLPRVDEVGLDPGVLAVSLGVTLTAALLSSLLPALEMSGTRPYQALKEGGAGASRRLRLRGALVVAEVALSLVLLVGAGLMMRSFLELQRVRPGFEPGGAVAYNLSLPFSTYGTPDDRIAFFQRMERQVEGIAGIEAVGGIFPMPLGGRFWTGPYGLPGESPEEWSKNEGNFRVTTPGYFEAMGARLVAGRTLETADLEQRRSVAVIDTLMASRAFGDRPAVGERLGIDLFGNPQELEVVGVVEHVRHEKLAEDDRETVYFSQHLFPFPPMTMIVRTASGDPTAALPAIRGEIERLDPELPMYNVRPLAAYVDDAMAQTRFATVLIGVFAAVAVILAAVGLFGVVAYAVRQRTREIGIRVALGAEKGSILRLVVGRGLGLVGAGVVLGLVAAFGLTRALASLLYGVGPHDPATFAAIPVLLAVIALAASWLPARRAAALDPMRTLRME